MRLRTMGPHRSLMAAALLAALFLGGPACAALLAVDLGSEFMKLSIVKPGRIPISIVINEMSKRKTPALVGFVNGDRLVGEEAASLLARYPERVYARLTDLLGRPADDPGLAAILKASYRPYVLVPAANRSSPAAAAVQTDSDEAYSAEELVASLLEYAKRLAEAAADGSPVNDCVLVVPASYTQQQRQALLDAAKLAGLNVLGLIHSHAAAALQYGIERDFANRSETLVLYDLGAASLQASLVTYSAYTDAKGASISQFEVRDVVWRDDLGGEQLELALVEHFASEFNSQLADGLDVRSSPRAMAKLRRQVARTKHILSANSEAPISVEELWQDQDFRSSISRDKFEELAGDFWVRAVEPVTALLQRNNLTADDITAFELLGGSSRVPRVKQALSEALGGRALDMHLDADEAVVLGAGLFAANLSTIFRLRQFGMTDKVPFSINITLEGEAAPKVLVPAMKRMPTKRAVHLHNRTADSLAFDLDFDNAPGAMPCCHLATRLGSFRVSGIADVISKYNDSGRVSIHTHVDQGGLFHVDRADATLDIWEAVAAPPPPSSPAADNSTSEAGNITAPGQAAANVSSSDAVGAAGAHAPGNSSTEDASAAEQAPKLRKRQIKVPLNVTGGFVVAGMTRTELEASRRMMRRLRAADHAKREMAKARNDLESYIIATRDKVENGEELAKVTTAAEREAFLAQLTETEDWLYGDGEAVGAAEYRLRLRQLRQVGDAMAKRAEEAAARPDVVKLANDFIDVVGKVINSWPHTKPWLNASQTAALAAQVDNFTSWFRGKQEEQAKLAPHEDPAFKTDEVTGWLAQLKQAFQRLNNKRQPKPPPPLKPDANATDGNATDGASRNATEAEAGPEAGAEAGAEAAEAGDEPGHEEL